FAFRAVVHTNVSAARTQVKGVYNPPIEWETGYADRQPTTHARLVRSGLEPAPRQRDRSDARARRRRARTRRRSCWARAVSRVSSDVSRRLSRYLGGGG